QGPLLLAGRVQEALHDPRAVGYMNTKPPTRSEHAMPFGECGKQKPRMHVLKGVDGDNLVGPVLRKRQAPCMSDHFHVPRPGVLVDVDIAALRAVTAPDFKSP